MEIREKRDRDIHRGCGLRGWKTLEGFFGIARADAQLNAIRIYVSGTIENFNLSRCTRPRNICDCLLGERILETIVVVAPFNEYALTS